MMASPLLSALDARIRKTRNPVENACLRAEKAALLARHGELDAARADLVLLRSQFDSRPHATVSAWASLAEGLVAYFEDFNSSARDKFRRALALSRAVQASSIQAVSAAWLAQTDFSSMDFGPMTDHLAEALNTAPATLHSARSRASLVAAEAYHWCERFDLALPWYGLARQHATAEGDEATLSALMHNMAWLRAVNARRVAISGGQSPGDLRQILLGAESTGNFDQRVGATSLSSLVPMLRAHVLVLLDQHAQALVLFEEHLESALHEGLGRIQCAVLAEIAWCRIHVGNQDQAMTEAIAVEAQIGLCEQPDERAAAHGRLAQFYAVAGDPASAKRHSSRAESDWNAHSANQSRLLASLRKIAPGEAGPTVA